MGERSTVRREGPSVRPAEALQEGLAEVHRLRSHCRLKEVASMRFVRKPSNMDSHLSSAPLGRHRHFALPPLRPLVEPRSVEHRLRIARGPSPRLAALTPSSGRDHSGRRRIRLKKRSESSQPRAHSVVVHRTPTIRKHWLDTVAGRWLPRQMSRCRSKEGVELDGVLDGRFGVGVA
jgi:hypothetical protein